MIERAQALVIGGGVVGCAVLRELAARGVDAILVEAEPDIGEGASKANSAIVHTGFDAKPGTMEATLLRRASALWPGIVDGLGVPFLRCGALMLARTGDEAVRLEDVARGAAEHGVTTRILDRRILDEIAPFVTPDAIAALEIPDEAIIDPFWLVRAYAESAVTAGARVLTRAQVTALEVGPDRVVATLADGRSIVADHAFDCAGIRADEVAALAGDSTFVITPRKGQFLVSERTYGVDRIVLPIPGPSGKGMLVTPIVFGGVLLGPTAEDQDDKTDRGIDEAGRDRIVAACRRLVPDVDRMDPIRQFAGVRTVSSTGDYVIRPSAAGDRLTLVAGIRSTGISASPAIAEAAVGIAAEARQWERRPVRSIDSGPAVLSGETTTIACVCRSIGDAEVDAALVGPLAAATTDGLKRRAGLGFGDCQGAECLPEAIDRIASARGVDPWSVEKGLAGSWIVAEAAPPPGDPLADRAGIAAHPADRVRPAPMRGDRSDVVVVGGGLAGVGVALSAAAAGVTVTVVDRAGVPGGIVRSVGSAWWSDDERAALHELAEAVNDGRVVLVRGTVVGLARTGDRWDVDVVGEASDPISARTVVLATGGYVTPREHLRIDGPRPSGIATADFALAALDRGWRPGTRAIVVGSGRLARGTADRLSRAGVEVVGRLDTRGGFPVRAVRGQRRLEAVLVGERWIDADTLVLAHALRPAAFLLRGLGLGDDRPGVPMPADATGRLPETDLWAAGTCVEPDVNHTRSLAAGRRIGRRVATTLSVGATTAAARV